MGNRETPHANGAPLEGQGGLLWGCDGWAGHIRVGKVGARCGRAVLLVHRLCKTAWEQPRLRWAFSCVACVCVCVKGVSAMLLFQSASACGASVVRSWGGGKLVQGGASLTSGVCARVCTEMLV